MPPETISDNNPPPLETETASALNTETWPIPTDKAKKIEAERLALLSSLSAGRLDTIQEKVAWILNRYPATRDSDITLQLRFWDAFEPELTSGDYVRKSDLYNLPRLTSLTRARAKIQNSYHLFQASADVQKQRGTLEVEEHDKAREQQFDSPAMSVYADESGKNEDFLAVGSLWFLHPPDEAKFLREIYRWKEGTNFTDELHFKNISNSNIHNYMNFAAFLTTQSAVLSFKAMTLARRGLNADDAIAEMYYLLLVQGVHHENTSGRAPLPRSLLLMKDMENESQDKLFLASLQDRLAQASNTRFAGQLYVDQLTACDSKDSPMLQIADLFTSSIRRVQKMPALEGPKDRFAQAFLNSLGMPHGPQELIQSGDMALHIKL